MIYSFGQLEQLWRQAGGPRRAAPVMAAIARAESGGNPHAQHVNSDGSVDRGLWQINSSHGYSPASSFNPLDNARQAVSIYHSQGLRAWTTFSNGAFRRFMGGSRNRGRSRGTRGTRSGGGWGIFSGGFAGVDQGTDWTRAGPIPALGDGHVTDVTSSHIIEGGRYPVVIYELHNPPIAGSRYVYIAENFKPTVRVGQRLRRGQTIGIAAGSYPYIEQGWNRGPKGWNPVAPLGSDPHAATGPGQQMLAFIQQVVGGTPFQNPSPVPGTTVPVGSRPRPGAGGGGVLDAIGGWFSSTLGTIGSVGGAGIGSLYGDVAGSIGGAADFLKAAAWLVLPITWLRIFEVLLGLGLMLLSVRGLVLIFASRDTPVDFYTLGGASRSLHDRKIQPTLDTTIPGNAKRRRQRRERASTAAKAARLATRFGEVPF